MGTENQNNKYHHSLHLWLCVKLNNPLMGTEKEPCFKDNKYICCYGVKLNNPLMGTEN